LDSSPIEFNWMNKSFYQIAFINKIMEEEIFCSEDSPVKMDSSSEGIGSNDPSFNFDPSGPVEDLTWDGVMALLKEKESICREKDEQLSIAGSTGLGLMEQVHSLQDELERQRKDHEIECEKWIQEIHELKTCLDSKEKSLQGLHLEYEEYRKSCEKRMKVQEEKNEELTMKWKREIAVANGDKSTALAELEQCRLLVQQLEEEVEVLRASSSNQNTSPIISAGKHEDEVFLIMEKLAVSEDKCETQAEEVRQLKNRKQSMSLELQNLQQEKSSLQMQMEAAEAQSTSYHNHLQLAREECQELKVELDLLKEDLKSKGHLKQGNSLFAEVEDKRAAMEKELKSIQVKHESLQKAYNFSQNRLRQMKDQVLALLQMNSGRADTDRINNLERALSQAQGQVQTYACKLKEIEASKNAGISEEAIKSVARKLPDFQMNKDLIDFMTIEIEDLKRKHETAVKDLNSSRMILLNESHKLRNCEQELYDQTVKADKFKYDSMRLKLSLEESKNKLQAEVQKRQLIEQKFGYDSSNDVVPEGMLASNQPSRPKVLPLFMQKAAEKKREEEEKKAKRRSEVAQKAPLTMKPLPAHVLAQLKELKTVPKTPEAEEPPLRDIGNKKSSDSSTGEKPLSAKRNQTPSMALWDDRYAHLSSDRPRKVSFKTGAEEIVSKTVVPDQADTDQENIDQERTSEDKQKISRSPITTEPSSPPCKINPAECNQQ